MIDYKTHWNPAFRLVMELKEAYSQAVGNPDSLTNGYCRTDDKTFLELWADKLISIDPENKQYQYFVDALKYLEINQLGALVLLRYARYSNIYDGEVECSGEDFWDRYGGLYRECRSVVINVAEEHIVLCPARKFYNVNELPETSIEVVQNKITHASVIEFSDKLDGSMQSARWYNNRVIMAGSQSLNPDNSWRLADGYRMIQHGRYEEMLRTYPGYTFIFEYISLGDAHVVKYKKEQEGLYLIGMRNVGTGRELHYYEVLEVACAFGVPCTCLFEKTLEQVMSELDSKSSDEAEGFVINVDGCRYKVKYNDYCELSKALSKLSSINLIIRMIADNRFDDLLAAIPTPYHKDIYKVANVVFKYVRDTETEVQKYFNEAPKDNKKTFMIWTDKNVPKKFRSYVKNLYFGKKINVIKSKNDAQPHYKQLNEMGITDYVGLFREEEVRYD